MDDNTLRVEFPVGKSRVIVSRPTPGQAFVMSLSNGSDNSSNQDRSRLVRRLTRVMEELMGRETWDSVIEEGLITGAIEADDLATLVKDVLQFDWDTRTSVAPDPDVPAQPDPEPVRPAPRVVSGG